MCASGWTEFRDYFDDVATFPIVPAGMGDAYQSWFVDSGAACIGTPDDAIGYHRAPAAGHRRLRRHHGAGAQLGGLGSDEAAL